MNETPKGAYIKLTQNLYQSGIQPPDESEFIIDLDGHTMRCVSPFVGSQGTESNCIRFMKGTKVTIKNGTIKTSSPDAAILIQNFADSLTLDNVTLQGHMSTQYVLSNNYGDVHIKNGSKIIAKGGHVAFDAHYGMSEEFDDGVTVSIDDTTVEIKGLVEYTKESRITDEAQFAEKAHIYIPNGYELTPPDGYQFTETSDKSKQELVKVN